MNRAEAARLCGVSSRTISNWIASGKLKAGFVGQERDITMEALRDAGLLQPLKEPVASFTGETVEDSREELQGSFNASSTPTELVQENTQLRTELETYKTQTELLKNVLQQLQGSHAGELKAKESHIESLKEERERLLQEVAEIKNQLAATREDVAHKDIMIMEFVRKSQEASKPRFRWPWQK